MATPSKPVSEDSLVQTVLTAFDTLFNKRDYVSAERFWSPRYDSQPEPIRRNCARDATSKGAQFAFSLSLVLFFSDQSPDDR
jgi:hypothetical protein